jgi:hypothetical protein
MWEKDWSLLGIEPTTDLAAIKKAYALKLRVTRPDDDAEAYQALRRAYERVQQWLKRQSESAADLEVAQAPMEPAPLPPPTATPPQGEAEQPPQYTVKPSHLTNDLELRWRRSGESALMHAWQEVLRELDHQPLSRQVEFSAAFARWVLDLPSLPTEFLRALDAHFGWLNDFRAMRQLEPDLAQALHEALEPRLRSQPVDPAVLAVAAPLRGIQALRMAGRSKLWLWLLFLVLQPTLSRHRIMLGPQWLQRLGLDAEDQRWLKDSLMRGLWARIGLATSLMFAACLAMFGDVIIALGHGVVWFFQTSALMLASLFAGALINSGPTLTTPTRRWALPLEAWRRQRFQPLLGLVWLLFAAGLAYLDAMTDVGQAPSLGGLLSVLPPATYGWASLGFGVAGLVLAWPLDGLHGCVAGGIAALVGYLATNALSSWLPVPSCLLIGAAWMLWAAAVHEDRLPSPPPVLWVLRPALNSFALGDRWTYAMAVTPLAACTAWAVLNDGKVSPLRIFVIWVLGILLVAWLQRRADAWGLRQLPASNEEAT